jgi:hypothetical protein
MLPLAMAISATFAFCHLTPSKRALSDLARDLHSVAGQPIRQDMTSTPSAAEGHEGHGRPGLNHGRQNWQQN